MRVTGSTKPNSVFVLGVAGGSGSGKTYFAQELQRALGDSVSCIIYQDNFYIDQSAKFDGDGGSVNFDHPDSLDFPLLAEKLKELKDSKSTQIPKYDFATHSRLRETVQVSAKKIVIVDGILIFHPPFVRELFNELVFFDTPETLRYQRRLERDVKERGRTPDGVERQFEAQVKPMHDLFVEPSKAHADCIICDLGEYKSVLEVYIERLSLFARS